MYESSVPLSIRVEAIAVFTQATDPWIDLETALGNLSIHLEKIVVALTSKCEFRVWGGNGCEVLFLYGRTDYLCFL